MSLTEIVMRLSHPLFRAIACRVAILSLVLPWSFLIHPHIANADETIEAPQIIIEEVAWAGSSLSQADEWIEIANVGDATTTLAGWSLRGAGGSDIFFPDDAKVGPRETYRIANYAETDEKSAVAVNIQLATTTVSLSNSALQVELVDDAGVVIDHAGDGSAPPAGSSSPKATMIRASTSTDAGVGIWTTATSSAGFKGGVEDFGMPGVCDICLRTEVITEYTPGEALDLLLETTSSTEAVVETDASSTEVTLPITNEATSTQETVPETSATSTISNESDSSESKPYNPQPTTHNLTAPLHISLSEAVSNPAAGPEWVELRIAEADATSTDRALELWDAAGRFMTIPNGSSVTSPGYLVLTLSSARLNNGGDDLSLRETSGITIELTTIPKLNDGIAWAKDTSGSWQKTTVLTPGAINEISSPAEPVTAPTPTPTPTPTPPSISAPQSSTTTHTSQSTPDPRHPTPDLQPRLTILLNELLPNPDGGKEWIELRAAETDALVTDRALELWDASGRIATIPEGTAMTAPGYLLVTLSSARLNNGGDSASLREEGGDVILDAVDIPPLRKGVAWMRATDDSWIDTNHPTPGAENIDPIPSEDVTDATDHDVKIAATTNNDDESLSFDNNMPQETLVSARVRLLGTVGSVPRLLGSTHAFILLGEDGRAAIVYLPKHLNVPAYGSSVRVMGTLTAAVKQLELRMKTSDVWMTVATGTPPVPRDVDFLAPGTEDAWALVDATGTVQTVGTKSFTMTADGVDVTVSVPTVVGYRTKRLTIGDTVHVRGLLDPRKEDATILVRTPEDIELISHAPESISAPTEKQTGGMPDWTPFGAAAGAVAMTGGLKRVRALFKRRKLEKAAAAVR